MIKMLVSARKRPGMTDAAFSEYWRHAHAALVRRRGPDVGFRRYVQCHRIEDLSGLFPGKADPASRKNGQAELWWDSIDAMMAAGQTETGAEANALLEADERRFCDVANLDAFLAEEQVLYGSIGGRFPGAKLVVELRRRADAPVLASWLERHRAEIAAKSVLPGVGKVLLNLPVDDERFDFARQRGWRPAPDASIELWFDDETALAAALATDAARAWLAAIGGYADPRQLCPLAARCIGILDAGAGDQTNTIS